MKNRVLEAVFFLGLFLLSGSTFAMGETPVSQGLTYLTNAMYGATGVTLATLAIMIVGLLCLGHVLRWSALAFTVTGISIIFGAGAIVRGITLLIGF